MAARLLPDSGSLTALKTKQTGTPALLAQLLLRSRQVAKGGYSQT